MKTISNILIALACLACAVCAQTPEAAFLRIVHAVARGNGNARFLLDGRDLYPQGYRLGQDTGGYGVPAGEHRISVRKDGLGTGTTRIRLKPGQTLTLIAFAERLPAENAEATPQWKIRFLRLEPKDVGDGYGLSVVSVCPSEETGLRLITDGRKDTRSVNARRLAITPVDLGKRPTEVGLHMGERKIAHISSSTPGNHVVVVYENQDGMVEAVSFHDLRFLVAG